MAAKFELGFVIDRHSALSLQHQLRLRLIEAMNCGVLRPGRKLPSSRELSAQIGIARNTVTLAYEALIAEGHLVSRPRSGIFVAEEPPGERITTGRRGLKRKAIGAAMLVRPAGEPGLFQRPPNWDQHPYAFLDGCLDAGLAPIDEWREALRLAFSRQGLSRWNTGAATQDDPLFLDELRMNVLPHWGVSAGPDEVLAAISARHGLFLAVQTLIQRSTPVLLDCAVEQEGRAVLIDRAVNVSACVPRSEILDALSQATPGAVLILGVNPFINREPRTRRRDLELLRVAEERDVLIIEFAPAPDLRDSPGSALSLRTLDVGGRVLLVGALAAVATLGQAPGFMSGGAALIERVRQMRMRIGCELSAGLQRAWSYYLALGHYTARLSRAHRILQPRRTALRDALQHYLHKFVSIEAVPGSSAYRVIGPAGMNAYELARAAAELGVLIEPEDSGRPEVFRMGVTSIPKERIRAGVEQLARLIRGDRKLGSRRLQDETSAPLSGKELQRVLSGSTWLYNTVYGEPCTIELKPDGELVGRAGYANDDCDRGRWWIENDRWSRQWEQWAYGEVNAYRVVLEGDQVRLFNNDGLLVDTSLIVRSPTRPRTRKQNHDRPLAAS
jgi:GntR family transcriptional regulator / MocR family aminotransferase